MQKSSRVPSVLRGFLAQEAAGGIVLMASAALALILANSSLGPSYFHALHILVGGMSVLHWINDGLMAIFFLLVGLEIKREMLDGELATWPQRALPCLAALGGMVAPAIVYLVLQEGNAETLRGWAIPTATDIAFALGVLALLGSRVPVSLKIFLTALAIIDDLGAVLIIALFYTGNLDVAALGGAAIVTVLLFAFNGAGVIRLTPYLILGVVLWAFMLRSGIHPTIAGVLLAIAIPLERSKATPDSPTSPLHQLERTLQPAVAFFILPIFGFANAGVSFTGFSLAALTSPVPLGVALGLFLGKQAGVMGASFLAIRCGLAELPSFATWRQVYGVAILCGIGFTMSLFIGLLAFSAPLLQDEVKIGVLAGSFLSALAGWALLRFR